jgi:outer membrane protein OmpA-like peptidoglycan-associated protein
LLLFAAVVCVWAQKKITVPKDFPTIQAALGEAVEGDTVYVRNGVYYENITLVDDVVLMGQDKKATIIDGRRKGAVVTGADGAVITGFTVRNGNTGILCKNTRPIIRDNIVIDNKGTGIHALVTLPDIVNNVVYRNEWTGIFLESVRGTRTSINHNVIMENGYSGIFCANRTEVLVRNNILYGNKQYGIFVGPEARKTRIVGNNIYANRHPFNENADNQSTRQQNMSVDPQFVAAGFPLHNYNTKTNSPLRGKGEEGADIGLSEKLAAAATPPPSKFGGSSDLDQYFSSPAAPEPSYQQESYSPPAQQSYGGGYGAPQQSYSPPASDAPMPINETVILHGVNFQSESADILEESYPVLDMIYASLAYYSNLRVEIAGHTDNQGQADFNKSLSYNRARSVMNYLVSRGIPKSRIVARGYGMERPIADNDSYEGRASNRRVEVIPLK